MEITAKQHRNMYVIFIAAVVGTFVLNAWDKYENHKQRKLKTEEFNRKGITNGKD